MNLIDDDTKIVTLIDELSNIEYSRQSWRLDHTWAEILLVILCSQICEFESFTEYEKYAILKLNFLRRFLPHKNGAPSRSTYQRVLSLMSPQKFQDLLKMVSFVGPRKGLWEIQWDNSNSKDFRILYVIFKCI